NPARYLAQNPARKKSFLPMSIPRHPLRPWGEGRNGSDPKHRRSRRIVMRQASLVAAAFVSLLALAAAPAPNVNPSSRAAQRLETLKKLAGEWVQAEKDGKPAGPVVSSIRVTAAGTAVE